MQLVLGIDTGGTYTDSVILDMDNGRIVTKAKALTTKEDLSIGVKNSLLNLDPVDYKKISMVSLSTTLATNAVVENKGGEAGLIIIGPKTDIEVPAAMKINLAGGHDIHGIPMDDLDLSQAEKAIREFQGKVDTIAVSSYLSVRNPEHELQIKDLIQKRFDIPVVCAHQLTTSLGFSERTVTAVLNAKLIPIIKDLNDSVKKVLNEFGIKAPLMVVKGDGCLMDEKMAQEKPIETILSGPAASVIGATYLAKTENAVILDMGGTTTDIAIVEKGMPRLNQEGANVGNWLTRVQAAEISTFGLGGDSYLRIAKDGNIVFGPQKACPLSLAASRYPGLRKELLERYIDPKNEYPNFQITDCFILAKDYDSLKDLTEVEKSVIKLLETGAHSICYLARRLDLDLYTIGLSRLINAGVIVRAGITPTDILHAMDIYAPWDRQAALIGTRLLAEKMSLRDEEFLEIAFQRIINDTAINIMQSVLNFEGVNFNLRDHTEAVFFYENALKMSRPAILNCSMNLAYPILAIGAPVKTYLPKVAEKLNAELLIPEHAEVANAVGAAAGKIIERLHILIRPVGWEGFVVYGPWERTSFDELDEAKEFAVREGKEYVESSMKKAGTHEFEIIINDQDIYTKTNVAQGDEIYIESRIDITAMGLPDR
jgi:N-methylhydantoinase A/oxoprolinase/acetone carboxylase beta subunit